MNGRMILIVTSVSFSEKLKVWGENGETMIFFKLGSCLCLYPLPKIAEIGLTSFPRQTHLAVCAQISRWHKNGRKTFFYYWIILQAKISVKINITPFLG